MDKRILNVIAERQRLSCSPIRIASNTVRYVEAVFDLGQGWNGFDEVKAVWFTGFQEKSTLLDSSGICEVPTEVLAKRGKVNVNLVGSVIENGELVERLTTYPIKAIEVEVDALVDGTETEPITPSQFEQFVEIVKADADRAEQASEDSRTQADRSEEEADRAEAEADNALASAQNAHASELRASGYASDAQQSAESAQGYAQNASESAISAENAKDDAEDARDEIRAMRATATTLAEGSEPTARFENGVLYLGIPKGDTGEKGNKGDTGNGISSITKTGTSGLVDTYTITFTNGQTTTFTVTNGAKGDTGNGIVSIEKTSTAGLVDTYTITYTDGATTTFTVTNGEKGDKGDTGEVSYADLSSLLPTDTASGAIASFPDGQSVIPALAVVCDIEPIQSGSGTPSPDNVRPISGRTEVVTSVVGKNLANLSDFSIEKPSWYTQEYWLGLTANSDGTFTETRPLGWGGNGLVYVGTFKAGTYYVSADVKDLAGVTCALIVSAKKAGTWENSAGVYTKSNITTLGRYGTAVTVSELSDIWMVVGPYTDNGKQVKFGDIQIELSSTATEYEPYNGTTHTTSLGRTVYGGEVEVVGGSLTDKMAMVDLGSLNYSRQAGDDGVYVFTTAGLSSKAKGVTNIISDVLATTNVTAWGTDKPNNSICGSASSTTVVIRADEHSDATSLKAFLSGYHACYELATPQTYQLTPTEIALLKGTNNVWCDTGEVEVTYKADIQRWVEKKLN